MKEIFDWKILSIALFAANFLVAWIQHIIAGPGQTIPSPIQDIMTLLAMQRFGEEFATQAGVLTLILFGLLSVAALITILWQSTKPNHDFQSLDL